ncbi:MAG: hypothetical protein KAU47_05415, partial [Candidatus Aminicenantes bacterium]|nr:hypothetical protein [Candidatus Aminicenantes bacterium]
MKLTIDSRILEKFPGLNLGVVVARRIDNHGKGEEILHMIRDRENEIRGAFQTETFSQEPKIESWRKAYS